MYLTEDGWIKDDDTSCLRDPVDILNYCRKVRWFTVCRDRSVLSLFMNYWLLQ